MLQNPERTRKIHLKDEEKSLIFKDIEEGQLTMLEVAKKHRIKYKTIISMRKERQDKAKDIKKYLIESTYEKLSKIQGPIKKFDIKREIRSFITNPSYYFKTLIINYNSIMNKRPFDENNRKIIDKIYHEVVQKLQKNQFNIQIKLKNEKRKDRLSYEKYQQHQDDDNERYIQLQNQSQIYPQGESCVSQSPFISDFLIQNNKFNHELDNFQQ